MSLCREGGSVEYSRTALGRTRPATTRSQDTTQRSVTTTTNELHRNVINLDEYSLFRQLTRTTFDVIRGSNGLNPDDKNLMKDDVSSISFKYLDDVEKNIQRSYRVVKQRQLSIADQLKQLEDEKMRILSNWTKHSEVLTRKQLKIAQLQHEANVAHQSTEHHRSTMEDRQIRYRRVQSKILDLTMRVREIQTNICRDNIKVFDRDVVDRAHPLMMSLVDKKKRLIDLRAELHQFNELQKRMKEMHGKMAKQQKMRDQLYQLAWSRVKQAEQNTRGLEDFMKELECYVGQLNVRIDFLVNEKLSVSAKRSSLKDKFRKVRLCRKFKTMKSNQSNLN